MFNQKGNSCKYCTQKRPVKCPGFLNMIMKNNKDLDILTSPFFSLKTC